MLASTPPFDHTPFRSRTHDHSISPSCRAAHNFTPPRLALPRPGTFPSPMLTPSPLRSRSLFNHYTPGNDTDDLFLQSPFKSPSVPSYLTTSGDAVPSLSVDDDEGSAFFGSSLASTFSPIFSHNGGQLLQTPAKQPRRLPSRPVLSVNSVNITPHQSDKNVATLSPGRVGVGTKRKSNAFATNCSTPLRQRVLTPLSISANADTSKSGGVAFDRLAPLPAPRFTTRTPHSKAETEVHLKKQTKTMTQLSLGDFNDSGIAFNDDSGCEGDTDFGDTLFLENPSLRPSKTRSTLCHGDKKREDIAEAISPGGHVTKRRARSRPLSMDLLESVHRTGSPAPNLKPKKSNNAITFPTIPRSHSRSGSQSSTSSSRRSSPLPRNRVNADARLHPTASRIPGASRLPLSRLESAGTLLFGPTIPADASTKSTAAAMSPAVTVNLRPRRARVRLPQRHSYAGPGTGLSFNDMTQHRSPPAQSSPPSGLPSDTSRSADDSGDMDDLLFNGPPNSSFVLNITENTPSPRKRQINILPRKYKPRDSGIVLTDDEDPNAGSINAEHLNMFSRTSSSVSSIYSDGDEALVTPGVGPANGSGWPEVGIVGLHPDETGEHGFGRNEGGVDAFILRTLAAAATGKQECTKRVPGTPVKKVKTSYLGERPWQSAVANKIGLGFEFEKERKIPRKSLPAVFPVVKKNVGPRVDLSTTDSEGDEEISPSWKRGDKYGGLGLGRPSAVAAAAVAKANVRGDGSRNPRTGWLMRRSSSGAFSFGGGESVAGTPTRPRDKDWNLHSRAAIQCSPSKHQLNLSPTRSNLGSSLTTLVPPCHRTPVAHKASGRSRERSGESGRGNVVHRYPGTSAYEQPGRFEREFVAVDEVGSGEFGKVIKVRKRGGDEKEVYAVKQSKPFEGVKHRLRLREEVEILQHLSRAVVSQGRERNTKHPNVLAYTDSWEEDSRLFICTELCELGNFARFLWEYGRVYPRLDEARVWKIVADLSNGVRFIHEAGVIHLDLKPANIFVTGEGRFKIGDFGMASLWPRRPARAENGVAVGGGSFEREGDKVYLAPEVLQGHYGKAADIFSFGMTILETAANIVVPDQGEPWHRLRQENFEQVDLDSSPELLALIKSMMRTNAWERVSADAVFGHAVVKRTRAAMERMEGEVRANGGMMFSASPLASVPNGFLEEILGTRVSDGPDRWGLMVDDDEMDVSV